MKNKTIGIIGGMGPQATCNLMELLIDLSKSENDQDYVRICVDNNTNIPDRTKAILNEGESPLKELVRTAIGLEQMGADVLIMPCNTAHYFYDKLSYFLDTPVLNMVEETAKYIAEHNIETVGLLATNGTIKTNIYGRILEERGINVVYPSVENQQVVMDVIYNCIKAGKNNIGDFSLEKVKYDLESQGAEKIILGCTELPIAFKMARLEEATINPTKILALAALDFVGQKIR